MTCTCYRKNKTNNGFHMKLMLILLVVNKKHIFLHKHSVNCVHNRSKKSIRKKFIFQLYLKPQYKNPCKSSKCMLACSYCVYYASATGILGPARGASRDRYQPQLLGARDVATRISTF
jgi:hypothetical protein